MLPILGPITPYRRVCGSIFLFIAVVLAPNVHFALKLTAAPLTAQCSIWGMLALYLIVIAIPSLRRVTHTTSMVALVLALVLAAVAMACSNPLKQMVATAVGFYDDALPWQNVQVSGSTWTYRNPFAGYSLQIPQNWEMTAGPIEGTSELSRRSNTGTGIDARLHPSCDLLDEPLAITVGHQLDQSPKPRRSCGHWQGLETCLLERAGEGMAPNTEILEWLGYAKETGSQIRLTFERLDQSARNEALAIINSARQAPASFQASACPNPSQWAEPASH